MAGQRVCIWCSSSRFCECSKVFVPVCPPISNVGCAISLPSVGISFIIFAVSVCLHAHAIPYVLIVGAPALKSLHWLSACGDCHENENAKL